MDEKSESERKSPFETWEVEEREKYLSFSRVGMKGSEESKVIEAIWHYLGESGMTNAAELIRQPFQENIKVLDSVGTSETDVLPKAWKTFLEKERESRFLELKVKNLERELKGKSPEDVNFPQIPHRDMLMFGHTGQILCCAKHPFEPVLLTGGEDCRVCLWNLEEGFYMKELEDEHDAGVTAVSFHRDGERFVTANDGPYDLFIWEYKTLSLIRGVSLRSHEHPIKSAFFGNDFIYSLSSDCSIRIWKQMKRRKWEVDFVIGKPIDSNTGEKGDKYPSITCMDIDASERYLAYGLSTKQFIIFDLEERKMILQKNCNEVPTFLKFYNKEKEYKKEEQEQEEKEEEQEGEGGEKKKRKKRELKEITDSILLLVGSFTFQNVYLVNLSGIVLRTFVNEKKKVKSGVFYLNAQYVALLYDDFFVRFFNVRTGELRMIVPIEQTLGSTVSIQLDIDFQKKFMSICDQKSIRVYELNKKI